MMDHQAAFPCKQEGGFCFDEVVKCNVDIFPEHFMFILLKTEIGALRSQNVTSNI